MTEQNQTLIEQNEQYKQVTLQVFFKAYELICGHYVEDLR